MSLSLGDLSLATNACTTGLEITSIPGYEGFLLQMRGLVCNFPHLLAHFRPYPVRFFLDMPCLFQPRQFDTLDHRVLSLICTPISSSFQYIELCIILAQQLCGGSFSA
jgi:hypothetical protein